MNVRRTATTALLAVGTAGTLLATAVAASAQEGQDAGAPDREVPGMAQMHRQMSQQNSGMRRMHELMTQQNPGMARMHELMTHGPR